MERRPYRALLVDLARAYGGAEVRALTQARALQACTAGCSVVVLRDSPLHLRLIAEALPCYPLALGRADPRLILRLRRIIRRGGYTIVDAHNVQSILWAHLGALLAGAPGRVTTLHSDFGQEYRGARGWLYEGVWRLDRFLARQFITVTEVLQAKAVREGLAARSMLIPNAVRVPPAPRSETDPALRATWGFSPDDWVVAILARLKPVKGHRYLIDALARLPDLPQIKLLIAGDGSLLPDLQAQVQASGLERRVVFAGFCDDADAVLRAADAVCMASLSEALPYAVLEAMAWARPLLVTAVGGMATLLEHERSALLVPPADSAALAEGLRWMAGHPAQARALGIAAYEQVRSAFSVEQMIDRVLEAYDRALAR